jgi:hypothetical protein
MSKLWVITTYFNPAGYKTRRINYDRFIEGLTKVGVPCLTIECAFNDEPFELPESPQCLQIRSSSVLWQKERLLNLGAESLPPEVKYVAWVDADVLFENPNWAIQTEILLEEHAIVQLFSSADRLDEHGISVGDEVTSFGTITSKDVAALNCGRYDVHGHTGYAWAMRREIFDQVGLYEYAASGGSDHFMAHAIYNDYNFCVVNALKADKKRLTHLMKWGHRFYAMVQGRFGCVPGRITHLWHGDLKNRRYFLRIREITDLGFDPNTDLEAPIGKPLQWSPIALNKPGLPEYFSNYFAHRLEDGVSQGA